jgi:Cof subfamily protein (haloacid dehalogenase superfamily)
MAIKLVAVDMDDTLLDGTLNVSPRTREAIDKAHEQGAFVTICTGRMFSSAKPFALDLNMRTPIITYNGGMIRSAFTKEMLFHKTIAPDVAGKLVDFFREKGWYLQSHMNDELYVAERCEKAIFYESLAGISAIPIGEKFYTMRHEPTKMLAMAEPHEILEIQKIINKEFAGEVFAATSKSTYLELTHPSVNKGHALGLLAESLKISREEVMAIGDSNNDIPMLEYAGFGVAMGNATDKIKAVAKAVTGHHNAHGVAEAIEKYVLK